MSPCFVRGVSVWGPGLQLWSRAREVLAGRAVLRPQIAAPPPPAMLAPNERRRSGLATRLALAVCGEAVAMAGLAPQDVRVVFASSNGEAETVHNLLEQLACAEPVVSPTQFHNSVHNTAAGYWSIGAGSAQPVTCLGGHDWSFAAGLLKAAAETSVEGQNTLLCVYDVPMPAPLAQCRDMHFPFAAALILSPSGPGLGQLTVRYGSDTAADGLPAKPELRALVAGNPAARALRLLEALAAQQEDNFALAYLDGRLDLHFVP